MALTTRDQKTEPARSTRRDPIADMERLRSRLSGIFDELGEFPSLQSDGFIPLADIEETDDAFIVEMELPGVDKRDIEISYAGRRLTVTGERKEKERTGVLRRRTRTVGQFRYEVQLPTDVDEDGVTASLDQGVLIVRVPKSSSERPRRIKVN